MNAECARPSCAQQATVLLAYDPRGATAWLRDLVDAHPSMGLMLCGDHAETTSVPMSWELIDQRSPDYEFEESEFEDQKAPSFDDIFPPRAAPEPDPYGLDIDLEVRQPAMTHEETQEAIANDPDVAALMLDDEVDESDTEAVELLAPELPASGTDGRAVGQPQLPMISTPPTRTPSPAIDPPAPGAGYNPTPRPESAPVDPIPPAFSEDLDFLYEEQPDESMPTTSTGPTNPETGAGNLPNGQVVARREHASPLFGKTDVSPQSLKVPPSATLLSRAFRTAQFD